jgi:hypothetical protein
VYFFFEPGEVRPNGAPRLVRVGTHAVSAGSGTTLWNRLSQHRGSTSGGGNHRGSVFRLHVGGALLSRDDTLAPKPETWSKGGSSPTSEAKASEAHVEHAVSRCIGAMPFTWVEIDDEPSAASLRAVVERHSLGLLSSAIAAGLEGPSPAWLGHHCRHETVRGCKLWNVKCVDGGYDPSFLDTFESLATGSVAR